MTKTLHDGRLARSVKTERLEQRLLFAAADLDTTFGAGGVVATDINGAPNYGEAVVVQSDGKVLVAGSTVVGNGVGDFTLVRYNTDGRLDDGGPGDITPGDKFGVGGKVVTHLSDLGSNANAMVVQSDGKIVVGGYETILDPFTDPATQFNVFAVVRYNRDGALDTSFGPLHTGIQSTGFGTADAVVNSGINGLALQADGKIIAAGAAGDDIALVRFLANGLLDPAFQGGQVTTDFGGSDDANAVAVQGDGRIVVAGETENGGSPFTAVIGRYNTDGTLDGNFGAGGKVSENFGAPSAFANALAIGPNGRIFLVGGADYSTQSDQFVAALNPNGSLFGEFVDNSLDDASGIAIQRDGRIVVVGSLPGDPRTGGVERFNPDLQHDATFNSGGVRTVKEGGPNDVGYFNGVAIAPDGKIVLTGGTSAGGSFENFAVARLLGTPTAPFASIGGQVFLDKDGDGVKDTNETGSADVTLSIDGTTQSVLTDLSGNYKLDGLPAGTYKVRVTLPSSAFIQTLPSANAPYTVALAAGQNVTGKNFGLQPPSIKSTTTHISGSVFNDLNANGVRDITNPTEPDLVGWKVWLDLNKNGVADAGEPSRNTDGGGNFLFDKLAAGTYRVRTELRSGYRRTTFTSGFDDITLTSGQSAIARFGVTQNVLITGAVFNDANGNAKRDTGEAGLSVWRVYLDLNNNGKYETNEPSTLTDSSGNFRFTTLRARSFVIRVVRPSNYTQTTPAGNAGQSFSLGSGGVRTGLLFGERKIA